MKYMTQVRPLIYSNKWLTLNKPERAIMLAIIINTKDTEFYGNYKTIALFTGLHEKSLPESL